MPLAKSQIDKIKSVMMTTRTTESTGGDEGSRKTLRADNLISRTFFSAKVFLLLIC
jgi:hypothetical protein